MSGFADQAPAPQAGYQSPSLDALKSVTHDKPASAPAVAQQNATSESEISPEQARKISAIQQYELAWSHAFNGMRDALANIQDALVTPDKVKESQWGAILELAGEAVLVGCAAGIGMGVTAAIEI